MLFLLLLTVDILLLLIKIEKTESMNGGFIKVTSQLHDHAVDHVGKYTGHLPSTPEALKTIMFINVIRIIVFEHFSSERVFVMDVDSYTLNNIGSVKRTLQYYYHATPGDPLQGSPGVAW